MRLQHNIYHGSGQLDSSSSSSGLLLPIALLRRSSSDSSNGSGRSTTRHRTSNRRCGCLVVFSSILAVNLFAIATLKALWILERNQMTSSEYNHQVDSSRRSLHFSWKQHANSNSTTISQTQLRFKKISNPTEPKISPIPKRRPLEERYKTCVEDLHSMIDEQQVDSTHNNPSTKKRWLPDFKVEGNKGGGVIIFWHIAKTGGTTVRKHCATLPGVDYMMLISPEDYQGGARTISQRLTPSPNSKEVDVYNHSHSHTLFVELHGLHALTVLDMEKQLHQWRSLSEQHGTPLFIFTILREPLAFSLSYFNFFHQNVAIQPTELELQRTTFNRQCHTLAASSGRTKQSCAQLYSKIHQWFDWVGTTDSMTDQTLPLLEHLLRHKEQQQRFAINQSTSWLLPSDSSQKFYNVAVPHKFSFHRESLSQETIRVLQDRTCMDRALWERAQHDFTLDMWQDNISGPSSTA